MRGATFPIFADLSPVVISIHAPHAGRDESQYHKVTITQ